jgi:WD40 repeat protein
VSSAPDEDPTSAVALKVWDTATGKKLRVIEEGDGPPRAEAPTFSPDGKLLAWRRGDGTICLADAATGKQLRRLAGRGQEQDHGLCFAFAPDGQTLVTRSPSDLTLRVWDVATGKMRKVPGQVPGGILWRNAHGSASEGMALAPDRPLLALASESHAVRLLDLATGRDVNALGGHACSFARVTFAPDGKTVTSSSEDGTLRLWEAASGRELRQIELPEQTRCHALSGDGRILACAHGDNTLTLREAATGRGLRQLPGPRDGTAALAFSPGDRLLAVQGVAGDSISIWLYDVATARVRWRIAVQPPPADPSAQLFPSTAVTGMAFAPDGKTLAAPIGPRRLGLWDVASSRKLLVIRAPDRRSIRGAVFSPDGRSLALDLGDDLLSVWEVATGKERRHHGKKPRRDRAPSDAGQDEGLGGGGLGGPTLLFVRPAPAIAVSPDGRLLAQAGPGGVVRLWDAATGGQVALFQGHRGQVGALAFAPDGKTLVSGSGDTTALVWDVAALVRGRTTRPVRPLPRRDLDARWADLAGDDAARAYLAICTLASAARQAAPFLRQRLRPATPPDAEKIDRLIGDLDHNSFAARQKASSELEKAGEPALPLMKQALAKGPPLEIRRRLAELIARLSARPPRGAALRELRAVEALEQMGTPEAVAVLKGLAGGAAGARLTEAARAALQRLSG